MIIISQFEMKRILRICILFALIFMVYVTRASAEADPNFYIYLCLGQSNMEGYAKAESIDEIVDSRFLMLAAVDFSTPKRSKGEWYVATPPIVRQQTGIGIADYFGRTMVAALPNHVKVGVVDVAIGGADIAAFVPDMQEDYVNKEAPEWMLPILAEYGNNPYNRLVELGLKAKEFGVIKGILLHQGETNNGQYSWLWKVKTVYESLLKDLKLEACDVPLLVGETVNADVGGFCAFHNTIIAQLPEVIPTAHVVCSNGCPCPGVDAGDTIHWTVSGYRTMGKRYAYEALRALDLEPIAQEDYEWDDKIKDFYSIRNLLLDDSVIPYGETKKLKVWGNFVDGHQEDISDEVVITSNDFILDGNFISATEVKEGLVNVKYTDFTGIRFELDVNVEVKDQNTSNYIGVCSINNVTANVFVVTLGGVKLPPLHT